MAEEAGATDNTNATVLGSDSAEGTQQEGTAQETQEAPQTEAQETKPESQEQEASDTKEADTKEGAPDSYEAFKVAEGVEVNEQLMGEFSAMAKEMDLSQENAQKLIDLVPKYAEMFQSKQMEEWDSVREKWLSDLKADSEFGGEKFNETAERANRTLRAYGDEELTKFLVDTGFGDNAALIKMFAKIDKALGEDKAVDGSPSGESGKTAAEVMYPSQGNKQ